MKKFKLIVAAIAVLMVVIVILQNTESVQTEILFMDMQMPQALLLFVAMALGFIGGLIAAMTVLKKDKPEKKAEGKKKVTKAEAKGE